MAKFDILGPVLRFYDNSASPLPFASTSRCLRLIGTNRARPTMLIWLGVAVVVLAGQFLGDRVPEAVYMGLLAATCALALAVFLGMRFRDFHKMSGPLLFQRERREVMLSVWDPAAKAMCYRAFPYENVSLEAQKAFNWTYILNIRVSRPDAAGWDMTRFARLAGEEKIERLRAIIRDFMENGDRPFEDAHAQRAYLLEAASRPPLPKEIENWAEGEEKDRDNHSWIQI